MTDFIVLSIPCDFKGSRISTEELTDLSESLLVKSRKEVTRGHKSYLKMSLVDPLHLPGAVESLILTLVVIPR